MSAFCVHASRADHLDTEWHTSSITDSSWQSDGSEQFARRDTEKFDSETWITALRSGSRLKERSRYRETWDLLHSYSLVGMNSKEILALLGPPSPAPEPQQDGHSVYYQVSPVSDHGAPVRYLELKYSRDKVAAFRLKDIVQDPGHFPEEMEPWAHK